MGYELIFDDERKILVGRVMGKLEPSLVQQMAAELANMIQKHRCTKMLNDLREVEFPSSVYDIYNIPRLIGQAGVPLGCKRALLVNELAGDFRFLETASINIGHQVRIFSDMDEAVAWLAGSNDGFNNPEGGE